MSTLGLRWIVDWSFFSLERSEARQRLMEMHRLCLIMLARTDVAHTEALKASEDVRSRLQSQSSELSEYFGPLVLDHSRLGSSVLGSQEDLVLLETVFCTLFPARTWATGSSHDQRDAMHVAWAIRYAFDGLITGDGELLRRKAAVSEKCNGFAILSPDDALAVAQRIGARAKNRLSRSCRQTAANVAPTWSELD